MRGSRGKVANSDSFNNLSVLKRVIYYYGPQTIDELVEHMRQARPFERDAAKLQDIYVEPALSKQRYFVQLPDGRWDIEWDQAQAEENRVAEKVLIKEKGTLALPELRKRVAEAMAKDVSEVQIDLDSDPKFAPVGLNHYALSEWHVLNDEAYELLAREPGHYVSEQEIISRLVSSSQFIQESIVFAPKADPRFKKGPGGTWGLAEWLPARLSKERRVEGSIGAPIPVQVTPWQMDRVHSLASTIQAFVQSNPEAVRPRQIVEYILRVQVGSTDYAPFLRAVTLFLTEHGGYLLVGVDRWRLKAQVPAEVWEATPTVTSPRVRGQSASELVNEDVDQQTEPDSKPRVTRNRASARLWKVVLSYVNWREGSLSVPASKRTLFSASAERVLEVQLLVSGSVSNEHPMWFNPNTQTLYGLRLVYDALGMLPGAVFYLIPSRHRTDQFILEFTGEVDPRVQKEQSRLKDLRSLEQRAREVGQSFREILIDVLRCNRDGLSFWEVFDQVSDIRPVAIGTLRNLLSSLPCFYQKEAATGKWFFDPEKPTVRRRNRNLRLRSPRKGTRLDRIPGKGGAAPIQRGGGLPEAYRASDEGEGPLESTPRFVESGETSTSASNPEGDGAAATTSAEGAFLPGADRYGPGRAPTQVRGTESTGDRSEVISRSIGQRVAQPSEPLTVNRRVAILLQEGIAGDRALIREYLTRFHGVSIDRGFLAINLPPPETIRRSRQALMNTGVMLSDSAEDLTTVKGKVRALLSGDDQLGKDDKRLIVEYYRQFHEVHISEEYLHTDTPAMETIRRSRQKLTSAPSRPEEADEDKEDPDWGWPGEELTVPDILPGPRQSGRGQQRDASGQLTLDSGEEGRLNTSLLRRRRHRRDGQGLFAQFFNWLRVRLFRGSQGR